MTENEQVYKSARKIKELNKHFGSESEFDKEECYTNAACSIQWKGKKHL
jgi:cell fate (sporulation/competence/biofilm development) regulator YmcA (YheA/YmcA/DUF963 family)